MDVMLIDRNASVSFDSEGRLEGNETESSMLSSKKAILKGLKKPKREKGAGLDVGSAPRATSDEQEHGLAGWDRRDVDLAAAASLQASRAE